MATGITCCGCLILPADFWQHLVAKLIPPFASSQLCSPRPAFSALCCTMGVMGGPQHSWASSSVSQLLPGSKTSSPGTAQALQKGSGESSQNFPSSLQPPVFLWALHTYIASGSVPVLFSRRTEKKNTHQCLEFHWLYAKSQAVADMCELFHHSPWDLGSHCHLPLHLGVTAVPARGGLVVLPWLSLQCPLLSQHMQLWYICKET